MVLVSALKFIFTISTYLSAPLKRPDLQLDVRWLLINIIMIVHLVGAKSLLYTPSLSSVQHVAAAPGAALVM